MRLLLLLLYSYFNFFIFFFPLFLSYLFTGSKNEKKNNNNYNFNFIDSQDEENDSDCSDYSVELDELSPESVIFSHKNLPQMSKSVNKTTKSREYGFEKNNRMSESKRKKDNRTGDRDKNREEGEGEGDNEVEKEVEQNHLHQFRYENLTKSVIESSSVNKRNYLNSTKYYFFDLFLSFSISYLLPVHLFSFFLISFFFLTSFLPFHKSLLFLDHSSLLFVYHSSLLFLHQLFTTGRG